VFVIDTETRHLPGPVAASIVRQVGLRMAERQPWLVYKKTDSTLRGNIAPELGALAEAFPGREVVYVPAYPAMNRTVRGGHLFVDGVPVHETAFAADSLNPIRNSGLQAVLGDLRATIVDCESDDDLDAAARSIAASAAPLLVAGPAAIAGALAKVVSGGGTTQPALPNMQRCLFVNGSMHPSSLAQIEYAIHHGTFNDAWMLLQYEGDECGVARALRLGESVKRFLKDNDMDALVIFGGDTAFGIYQALGAPEIVCCGEVLPGVPFSRAGGLEWITKAGGFGTANMIEELRNTLRA
jgi:uncharacterized protein YgbK (DUF1537 family)